MTKQTVKTERLQKILSQAGMGSRRELERLIEAGQVTVNGRVAQLGDGAMPHDKIMINGRPVRNPLQDTQETRVILYHKPIGEICSRHDPFHTKTVFKNLPYLKNGRWVQVGRLDINTSGLLIFTNNGELANRMMHPQYALDREYAVRVLGKVDDELVLNLLQGVELEDGMAKFEKIDFRGGEGANTWYHVVLREGRNREVRRLWQSQGVEVSRLIRIRYGSLSLPRSLSRGQYKELTINEVKRLLEKTGLYVAPEPSPRPSRQGAGKTRFEKTHRNAKK